MAKDLVKEKDLSFIALPGTTPAPTQSKSKKKTMESSSSVTVTSHSDQETSNLISEQPKRKSSSSLEEEHGNDTSKCSPPSTAVHGGGEGGEKFEAFREDEYCCGRERLKRHRVEVASSVWIPDIWGQEDFLTDWIDCSAQFDASLMHTGILSARAALVQEGRRANSGSLSVENRC